jgi:hypothetical protein
VSGEHDVVMMGIKTFGLNKFDLRLANWLISNEIWFEKTSRLAEG